MKQLSFSKAMCLAIALPSVIVGCATIEQPLADGRNVRAVIAAQIDDVSASERHGTAAPQGTDSEVAAASVRALRQRSSEGASKPGLFESLFGALAGK